MSEELPLQADLVTLSEGQAASTELPMTEKLLLKLEKSVETRIAMILESGEALSPDIAIQAWIEKFAYRRLHRRLTQQVVMGQNAGEELAPHMKTRK